jgi:threonine dehydratase
VKRRGIITFSAGNAAAAYAWAGRAYGIPVEVVMPATAVPAKIAACKAYGAIVHLVDGNMGTAGELKSKLVAERGLIDAHPFDDPFVIAGHGSMGIEILEQIPEADVVIGGLGGGGMLCGASVALRALKPEIRLYGVEPDGSSAVKQAVDAGGVVPVTPVTVADGLGAPYAGSWTLPLASSLLDGLVTLPDEEILGGLRFAMERLKQVVEPAGAAALAALLFGHIPVIPGDRVVVILSGGNVDLTRIPEFLERAAPVPGA